MVGRILAIHHISDFHDVDRLNSAIDEAVINMFGRCVFGIVAVEGGTPILRGHSIHIGVMLDHSGIAGAVSRTYLL